MKKGTILRNFAILVIMLIYSNFIFSATPNWQLVPENPNYPRTEAIVAGFIADVATYGNGTTDATSYLQGLLNDLDAAGGGNNLWSSMKLQGGGILYLPAGKYKISGQLIIPKGVTIYGDWKKPVKGQPVEGTILMAYAGKNITDANIATYENNSFIKMQSGAAVYNLTIWYPEQTGTIPYAPTILMGHRNGPFGNEFCNVKNVTLVNSYDGVIFSQIGGTCPTINGLYGTPLHKGVEIDRIVDIGRIEHCDFSPIYWATSGLSGAPDLNNSTFRNQLYNNATGIVMRRNDWSYCTYLKVEGYNKGFFTTKSLQADNGSYATPNGQNYGFNFSNCKYGLYFDSRAGEGCMFTEVKTAGCEYGAYFTENAGGVAQLYKWDVSATKCAIYTDKNAFTKITMQESIIRAGKVLLQGGTLVAINNDFNNSQPQIEFEANSRGDIIGNRSDKSWNISQKSVFQNTINHTPVTVTSLPSYKEFIPVTKKPTKMVLYNVMNYGVTKGTKDAIPDADATMGIQNALNAASSAGGGIVYLPPGHYRINGQLTIPSGVELKGSMDVSAFPLGTGSVLEIYNTTTPAVIMNSSSGMRGINFNYPTQVYCTVMPNPIDFPFTICGNGNNIYIVNVAMRCSNRGVDLSTNRCDNFYIDFLTGYFFREGVNIKNSDNGILANMQCNTIVYNNGDELKFGIYPNSNRPSCGSPADKDPYLYNSKNMNFLTLENCNNILLYGDFNYNALVGLHVKNNVNGLALGFALDDDRTMLLLDGSNIQLNFINLQGVALQRGSESDGLSSYIKSSSNFSGTVNFFNSDYWGYAGESGIVMNGGGTINMYGGNFMHSGNQSFAKVNNGYLNVVGSVVNNANSGTTYSGNATSHISTIGSIIGGNASGNTNLNQSPTISTSGALNDCNTWTATASYTYSGNAQNIVNCNTTDKWNSGWQNSQNPNGAAAVNVVVDMKENKTFNEVILDYGGEPNDGPETYVLEVSTDNANWTQVATGSGRNTALTVISFPTQTARYIRITKPASNTANFWAIDNLYVVNVIMTNRDNIPAIPDGTPAIGADLDNVVPVTGVTMTNVSVAVGSNVTLQPIITPSNATNKNVTFTIVSGSDKINLNTATGLVTGKAIGTATVQVTTQDGGYTATATVTVTAQTCNSIRTVRFQSWSDGGKITAINLTDNSGTLQWADIISDNSAWYEIPVDGSSTDFYYKNVGTGKYLYREETGKKLSDCDWTWEYIKLSTTNAKTDYYKFRLVNSTWDGRYWIVNIAGANFSQITNKGAFILSGINNNHQSCNMPNYPTVVASGIPNDNNVWHSTAVATVNASVTNPDCQSSTCDITISVHPQGATYTAGSTASALTVMASGSNLSYIWYKSTDNSNNTPENDTQVGSGITYIPNTSNSGTYYYYVKITSDNCSVNSNIATIVVTAIGSGPTYPAGYPKTMAMQNPLFWQFGSPKVDAAGILIPGSNGNLYTADPSARVWNINGTPTLFVYSSHDMEQAVGCDRMDRYHVFSTTDMVNWIDYGEIVKADDVPWNVGHFDNGSKFMWAPDCVYKNGKYYFYFPHPTKNTSGTGNDWGSNWRIGIATSDFPASNFTILPQTLGGMPTGQGNEYDPCVFIDDDGKAYFYYGGGGKCYGAKLKDNMIEIDGTIQEMQGLNNFHEGTWVHKYNGKYYLSYSDNGGGGAGNGDQLKYAISDNPLGPWESKGVFVYATGCGTIHGSIVEFNGQWYVFYHSDYVSNNGDQGRSVHVDKLFYNPDGTIQVVKNWGDPYNGPHNVIETANTTTIAMTLQAEDFNTGGETYGFHDTKAYTVTNTNYRTVAGVNIENRNGGYTIGDIANKEFLRYTINVAKAGLYDIDVYVASTNANGKFHFNVNGVNKSGTVNVPNTGDWGTFQKITATNIPLKLGENLFEIRVETGGFNLDRFEFRRAQPYLGTPFKTLNVPGKVEAEDFDNGGKNVAWYDNDDENKSDSNYRPGTGVDLETENGNPNLIHISWTNSGEWTKYTLNVTQTGTYDVTIRVSTGNGTSGSLSLTFDDVDEYPSISTTTASWNTYTTVTVYGVQLTKGTHVMQMTIGGNINVDWYQFDWVSDIRTDDPLIRKGEITAYPNPTTGVVYLNKQVDLKVYDLQGVLLKTTFDNKIDLSAYIRGLYLLRTKEELIKIIKE